MEKLKEQKAFQILSNAQGLAEALISFQYWERKSPLFPVASY